MYMQISMITGEECMVVMNKNNGTEKGIYHTQRKKEGKGMKSTVISCFGFIFFFFRSNEKGGGEGGKWKVCSFPSIRCYLSLYCCLGLEKDD